MSLKGVNKAIVDIVSACADLSVIHFEAVKRVVRSTMITNASL